MRIGPTALSAVGFAVLSAVGGAAVRADSAVPGCLPEPAAPGLGTVDPFHVPASQATELNTAAKALYRQGKWDEARAQYRAALAADPDFLAPRLNIACSLVRQERFPEATAEARALLERAYVPWAREVLEAADMGALKVRPEMKEFRAAMAEAARKWGEGLSDSLVFVARQRPPLRVPPTGEGVFILNPHQEVYAFIAETGRFRQLTAEDGRVLALARSADRRRISYVTAEKLVRGAKGDLALRGVALGELSLPTMVALPPIRIDGDVQKIEIGETPGGFTFHVTGERLNGFYRRGAGDVLSPLSTADGHRGLRRLTLLTPRGTSPATSASDTRAGCAGATEKVGAGGVPTIVVHARGRADRRLGNELGAGFAGLPLP